MRYDADAIQPIQQLQPALLGAGQHSLVGPGDQALAPTASGEPEVDSDSDVPRTGTDAAAPSL